MFGRLFKFVKEYIPVAKIMAGFILVLAFIGTGIFILTIIEVVGIAAFLIALVALGFLGLKLIHLAMEVFVYNTKPHETV